jgi:hypothetical protein
MLFLFFACDGPPETFPDSSSPHLVASDSQLGQVPYPVGTVISMMCFIGAVCLSVSSHFCLLKDQLCFGFGGFFWQYWALISGPCAC